MPAQEGVTANGQERRSVRSASIFGQNGRWNPADDSLVGSIEGPDSGLEGENQSTKNPEGKKADEELRKKISEKNK